MNNLQTLILKLANFSMKESRKFLGRWTIDYCEKRIENKVNWSNEDHCGTCSRFQITQHSSKEMNKDFLNHKK
ncbi:MAG: hypothetical protein EBT86_00065 [Actinobacteria bacterium]|nr:hypothetical protein [Actinomycetota bacterium]